LQDVSNPFRNLPGVAVLGKHDSGRPGANPVFTGLAREASGGLQERLRRMHLRIGRVREREALAASEFIRQAGEIMASTAPGPLERTASD
jgi:hypothetical protein